MRHNTAVPLNSLRPRLSLFFKNLFIFLSVASLVGLAVTVSPRTVAEAQTFGVIATDNDTFVPPDLTIGIGDVVNWTTQNDAHELRFDDANNPAPMTGIPFFSNGGSHQQTFLEPGTYLYRCDFHSDNFNSGMVGSITVEAPASDLPPVANAGGPYNGNEGGSINFSSAGSSDPDGTINSYSWDFGDGNSSAASNPSHSYADDGSYTVTLEVTDNTGLTDTDTTTADVANVAPTPDAGGPYTGSEGEAIVFNGSVTDPGTADRHTFAWDLGDGSTGSGASYSPTYASGGTYTVTLVVNDGTVDSAPASTTATISVAPTCESENPVTTLYTMAKGQSSANNAKVHHTITGHIVGSGYNNTTNRIKICQGTAVFIEVTDTTADVANAPAKTPGIDCTSPAECGIASLTATEKYKVVSSDGKDTDRVTLIPYK